MPSMLRCGNYWLITFTYILTMKKFKLNLDDLHVQSFDTTPAAGTGSRGTVYGAGSQGSQSNCGTEMTVCFGLCGGKLSFATDDDACNTIACGGGGGGGSVGPTCQATCNGTCDGTCTCANDTAMNTCAGFGDTCDCSCIATAVFCG